MADKVLENNQVNITGVVDSEFTYSHEVFGEGFYIMEVVVNRLSNMADRIPLMISERLVDVTQNYIRENGGGHAASFARTINMKRAETDSFSLCSSESLQFWKMRQSAFVQIVFIWMDLYASSRCIV